ncbi:hypothetical protein PybrP1_008464, partial [[Pythium] brassicae (nom. inval.)]
AAVESAQAFNSALSLKMSGTSHEIAELAQLHMINRVLSATTPDEDITFSANVFELALMSAPPTTFTKDHWIQFVTGEPVQWVPAHHARLLHPNALLKLLRSDLVLELQVADDGSVALENGHLLIEHLLSRYSVSCLQETKFADRHHLDTFRFYLESAFAHKLFVNDDNALLDRPTQGRSNGVLTVLRSDFPGFDSAAE